MSAPILTGVRLERFWKQRIRNAGFNPEPFVLRTDRPKDTIHREQYVAAMTIFYGMYCDRSKVSWVHLVAEMQAGKTGVCDALVRIIRQNVEDDKLPEELYQGIFVVTGLSDCSWVKQTRERLPRGVNVYHGPTLGKMQVQLKALAERPEGLRNILVIVDESHVASAKNNRPYKCIYSEVRTRLPDANTWAERNVHFLTVSATDPHAVLMMAEAEMPSRAVALETTVGYQSVRALRDTDRIRNAANIGSTPETIEMLREAVDAYEAPRYHIIRAEGKLNPIAVDLLKEAFPEARVLSWDAKSKAGASDGSLTSENDINELLSTPPEVTTFIVIKRMFSCAKTMVDRHVGVLWDYVSEWDDKDSVRLQSLLGRACGYGRSKDTVVYTSMRVVDDYLEHWRDAMRSVERMREAKDEAPDGNWKNVGVWEMGGKLKRSARHAAPVAPAGDAEEDEVRHSGDVLFATRPDGSGLPLVFATLEAARAWAAEHLTRGASAFLACDHEGKKTAQTHFKYRGVCRTIRPLLDTTASGDLAWGQGEKSGTPRIMPVTQDGVLGWIVVFKPHFRR